MNIYVLGAALAFVVAAVLGAGVKGYLYGRESRENEVISLRSSISAAEALARDYEARGKAAAARAKAEYAAKAKVIRIEAENAAQTVQLITRETTPDCRTLPAAWRVLWDGYIPTSKAQATGGVDVAAADLAEATAEARRRFQENAAQLEALQQYIRESVGNDNQQN